MSWLVPFTDLSLEQHRAVEASPDQHRLIVGAPGSGKTLVLLHRAKWLRERFHVKEGRYRVFVFTNVLKDYVRAGCADLGIPADIVSTYDAWCGEYFDTYLAAQRPWDAVNRRFDFAAIRSRVREDILHRRPQFFDFVLVDEGQDLDAEAFEVLRVVARHVTVAADRKQQLYDHGASEEEIANRLGLPRRNLSLLGAFRCSPFIVPLAAAFIADPVEAAAFRAQTLTMPGPRETPVLFVARDFGEERTRLGEVIRERVITGERVAILLPLAKQTFGFQIALRELGLNAEVQGRNESLDFSSAAPKLITFHSAKGLTFDSVLVPRIVNSSFRRRSDEQALRMMFVAITRATRWVYLSTVGGQEPPFLSHLDPVAASGDLAIRPAVTAPTAQAIHPESRRDLDDLFV
jgi:superfamily I DNA/RNA helicase